MTMSLIYETSGKIIAVTKGTWNNGVSSSGMTSPDQKVGVVMKCPKEVYNLGTYELLKRVHIKHVNADGTVEIELGKE